MIQTFTFYLFASIVIASGALTILSRNPVHSVLWLIVAFFMHLAWERVALVYAILVPPLALGTLALLMGIEADYIFSTRILFFGGGG